MDNAKPSQFGRVIQFCIAHRRLIFRATPIVLLLIVVLQNWQPIRVNVFFWSLPAVPKLVLIFVSAGLGAIGATMLNTWRARRVDGGVEPPEAVK